VPSSFLDEKERARFECFPQEVPQGDLVRYFALSERDLREVRKQRRASSQLAFALHLGTLRYLGFVPKGLGEPPGGVLGYLAAQLGVEDSLSEYGRRAKTRTALQKRAQDYLNFRKITAEEKGSLVAWLLERALEHDDPRLLLELACDRLRRQSIVRPRVAGLERLVARARKSAEGELYRRLQPLLGKERRAFLDALLVAGPAGGLTSLQELRTTATGNTADEILRALEKLAVLKGAGVEAWDLSVITPNRRKIMARTGRKATNQNLARRPPARRYPVLLAFLKEALTETTDEVLHMFESCLWERYSRSKRAFEEHWLALRKATNEKLRWFKDIGGIVLDSGVSDASVRTAVFRQISRETLAKALEETEGMVRPQGDRQYDFFARRYPYLRRFVPRLLELVDLEAAARQAPLLQALENLRHLDEEGGGGLPEDTPLDFVDSDWRPYVVDDDGQISRRYYELCALWSLRHELRVGNVWATNSRRYAEIESYLIPRSQWPRLRIEVAEMTGVPADGAAHLEEKRAELEVRLARLDRLLAEGDDAVRLRDGRVVLSPNEAEERPASAVALEREIARRIPEIDLPDLVIEVDGWTGFSETFEHAGGARRRSKDFLPHLYAALLAHACNFGLEQMAQVTDITYDRLAWCTTWYLREETLRGAFGRLVNYHHSLPLARSWGGGTLSSSDGQRFPASRKVRTATALPKYFGYGRGLTFYSWTSDQFSQYGTKVIPTTARDATYVLDEILKNETELQILEHTTDTAGHTEIVAAFFDLLGLRFAPRMRDLPSRQLFRLDSVDMRSYPRLRGRVLGTIGQKTILKSWDELLRVAGSLKLGWVTASLLIQKLQRAPPKSPLVEGLRSYGRIPQTIHLLEWYADDVFRRRIYSMLNKGEALHALRLYLKHANRGLLRRGSEEELLNEAACLNLVVNAIIVWNTVYMGRAIQRLRQEGFAVRDEDLPHLWPTRFEHINVHGKMRFHLENRPRKGQLRTLRDPEPASNLPPIP